MSIINSQPLIGAAGQSAGGGYQIARSLRFNSADQAYVSRTFSTPTDNKKWTYSVWMKRSAFGTNQTIMSSNVDGAEYWDMKFNTSDQIAIQNRVGSSNLLLVNTTAVFRDPSAWYHIVFVFDSANGTAAYRNRLYVNNVEYTLSANSGSSNASAWNTNSIQHNIGVSRTLNTSGAIWAEFNGYQTEINFIDGQALTPSSFGQTNSQTGIWEAVKYTGTYGTNGFYLNFSDNSGTTSTTLGKDSSGNGNNWTPNNFSVTAGAGNDSLVDTPTSYGSDTGVGGEVRGNYCTLNLLSAGASATLSNGNLDASLAASTATAVSTIAFDAGTTTGFYAECLVTTSTTGGPLIGIRKVGTYTTSYIGSQSTDYAMYSGDGNKYNNGSNSAYGSATTDGNVIGIAVKNGKIYFRNQNGWFNSANFSAETGFAFSGITGDYVLGASNSNATTVVVTWNFGQRPFAYTAPSGFKALCTQNLPTPTIGATSTTQAGKYFNPVLYSSTGTNLSVTGVGFQPDFVWIKSRSSGLNHVLNDAVRGATKELRTNSQNAESTVSTGLTSFNSDGFSIETATDYNLNTATYVAWNWKANGSGSSNTSGTITSTVSANTTAGFSIVTYTGTGANATVGHGLGVAPKMIIVKSRTEVRGWPVYNANLPTPQSSVLTLNSTDGSATSNSMWNDTAPTSTVFTVGTNLAVNNTSQTYVAYCFAAIAGYSAFGSYTGNGSTDGPFVYTGFRPRFILFKESSAAGNDWYIYDAVRSTYNVATNRLFPNSSAAELTNFNTLDILSNGWKVRDSNSAWNANGSTYIYAAFAESPFKYSLAR